VQGVGQPQSIGEAPEQGSGCAKVGGGGGEQGAGQGEHGRVYQGPDAVPGNPVPVTVSSYAPLRLSGAAHAWRLGC